MEHTDRCKQLQAEYKARHDEWVAKWPNYCKECDGAGGFYYPGGYDIPDDYESCPTCVQQGICPRCGMAGISDYGDEPCPHCGWNDDEPCPPQFPDGPCECQVAEWDKAAEEARAAEDEYYAHISQDEYDAMLALDYSEDGYKGGRNG